MRNAKRFETDGKQCPWCGSKALEIGQFDGCIFFECYSYVPRPSKDHDESQSLDCKVNQLDQRLTELENSASNNV